MENKKNSKTKPEEKKNTTPTTKHTNFFFVMALCGP